MKKWIYNYGRKFQNSQVNNQFYANKCENLDEMVNCQ